MSTSNTPGPTRLVGNEPRRGFLVSLFAGLIGAIVGFVPFAAGVRMFGSPLFRRGSSSGGAGKDLPLHRVASVDSLPTDGTPVQVPVIADLVDAWNNEPHQPIGAVYLRRLGDGTVKCFNAICP